MKIEDVKLCSDAAVCFETGANTLVAASYDTDGELHVARFAGSADRREEFLAWRNRLGRETGAATVFRYVPELFMEQTRTLALPEEILHLGDDELTEWLIAAASSETNGEDGRPVFESSLDDSAHDYTRLPGGFVALTEIPREAVEQARLKISAAVIAPENSAETSAVNPAVPDFPDFTQAVETRVRAVTRFLADREHVFFSSLAPDETLAFFCFTPEGAGFALWNPANGFCVELGDFFHIRDDEQNIPDGMDKATFLGHLYGESVYNFLNDQFYRRIVPDDESHPPVNLKRVYWTAAENFTGPLEFILGEFAEQTNFQFVSAGAPLEEMVVSGLLLGAFEESTELIPAVNLANDLRLQWKHLLAARDDVRLTGLRAERRAALLYVLIPIICALGFISGLLLNNGRISSALDSRQSAAVAEKARLAPLLTQRAEYEKTLSWYEDVLRQIIELRRKQTAALGFAARLDPLYPRTASFYISNLKLLPGGNFEIKGLARDQFAVSEFARQLEFAQAEGTEARYFSNLTLEFKQGTAAGKPTAGNPASGVSSFTVKGNFAPAGAIVAQDAKPVLPPLPVSSPAVPQPAADVKNGGAK